MKHTSEVPHLGFWPITMLPQNFGSVHSMKVLYDVCIDDLTPRSRLGGLADILSGVGVPPRSGTSDGATGSEPRQGGR